MASLTQIYGVPLEMKFGIGEISFFLEIISDIQMSNCQKKVRETEPNSSKYHLWSNFSSTFEESRYSFEFGSNAQRNFVRMKI